MVLSAHRVAVIMRASAEASGRSLSSPRRSEWPILGPEGKRSGQQRPDASLLLVGSWFPRFVFWVGLAILRTYWRTCGYILCRRKDLTYPFGLGVGKVISWRRAGFGRRAFLFHVITEECYLDREGVYVYNPLMYVLKKITRSCRKTSVCVGHCTVI